MKMELIGTRSVLFAACVFAILPVTASAETPTLATAIPVEKSQAIDSTAVATSVKRNTPAATPLIATVQLLNAGTPLRGQLISTPQISVTTSFGDVDVPFSEVAGIKVASASNPTTTVVLHNGDSITGACDIGRIDLKTEWGRAEVEGTSINTILLIEGVSWVSDDALGGKRWQLIDNRTKAATKAASKELKKGDQVIAKANTDLKHGTRSIAAVSKGEKLTVTQINGDYLYVKAANNRAGWLMLNSVQLTN